MAFTNFIPSSAMSPSVQSQQQSSMPVIPMASKTASTAIAFLNATVRQDGESQTGNIPCSSYALTPYLLEEKASLGGQTDALVAALRFITEMKSLDAEGKQIMQENTKKYDKILRDLLNKIINNPNLHGKVCKKEIWIDPETGEEVLTLESHIHMNKPKAFRKVIKL